MPRSKKSPDDKTVQISVGFKASDLAALKDIADGRGVSVSAFIADSALASLSEPSDTGATQVYQVGSEVDRKMISRWQFDSEVIYGKKEGSGRRLVEDRSAFVAHGLIWIGRYQQNGTCHTYDAIAEVPDWAVEFLRAKSDPDLLSCHRALKTLSQLEEIYEVPFSDRELKSILTTIIDLTRDSRYNGLEQMADYLRLTPKPVKVAEAIAVVEAAEAEEVVVTKKEAKERWQLTNAALTKLEVGSYLETPDGNLTRRSTRDGSSQFVLVGAVR